MKDEIISKVSDALIRASATFREDLVQAYKHAIESEKGSKAKWVLETILENALVAERNKSPLCDDTGIPHLFIEIGKNRQISGEMIENIKLGVAEGLRKLPGRPMAVLGEDLQRIDQSIGLSSDPHAVEPTPILLKTVDEDVLRVNILMHGGGPEIRAKTYRIFHKHDTDVVRDEIINWASQSASELGCTPCTLAIGIGRSHYEATSLMIEAQVYGRFDVQSDFEKEITKGVNESKVGALGLGGKTTTLATFVKVGPQRASGVRIVCMRPCCCVEPRLASVEL